MKERKNPCRQVCYFVLNGDGQEKYKIARKMLYIKYNYVSETLDLVDNFYPRKNEILCNFALNDGLKKQKISYVLQKR